MTVCTQETQYQESKWMLLVHPFDGSQNIYIGDLSK